MSHYEERLERDLQRIHTEVHEIGVTVATAVEQATTSVLTGDRALAASTILGDLPVNRRIRRLDRACHTFVVRHLPSAGQLRFVSSVMRLSIALERIGDYAATIAREGNQLASPPPETVSRDMQLLSDQALDMLRQAIQSFDEDNADLARGTKGMAGQVDAIFARTFDDLIREGSEGSHSVRELFAMLVILNRLERVSDQAKNLCEEAIFTATGETKEPKVYRVLFVDERDDSLTHLAVAYARRAFPEGGHFDSAGLHPAAAIAPAFLRQLDDSGYSVSGLAPELLDTRPLHLDHYHVLVGINCDLFAHLPEVPFHSVCLRWDVDPAAGDPASDSPEALAAAQRRLAGEIRGLMETLRGEEPA
jgi:phosphate transport system protein